jgi:T5SS/PEP-CTERM-associated repeat protein
MKTTTVRSSLIRALLGGSILLSCLPVTGSAQSWIGGSGKWENGADWFPGTPSTNSVATLITNTVTETVSIDGTTVLSNALNGCLTISNLTVSGSSGVTNTLFLNDAGLVTPLSVLNTLDIQSNAALVVNASVVQVSGDLLLGHDQLVGNNSLTIIDGGEVYDVNGSVGVNPQQMGNMVIVSGNGSTWNNRGNLSVGKSNEDHNNQLIVTNGGVAYDNYASIGFDDPISGVGSVVITGAGSVWSNRNDLFLDGGMIAVADGGSVFSSNAMIDAEQHASVVIDGSGSVWSILGSLTMDADASTITVSAGGMLHSGNAAMEGLDFSALVTGTGSVWTINGNLGVTGEAGCRLTITDGGAVDVFGSATVAEVGAITISDGVLYVTNGLGTAVLGIGDGTLTLNSGTVTLDQLTTTDPRDSSVVFNGGVLHSKGTTISGPSVFAVGDGADAATFSLDGGGTGIHAFTNGLSISSNAVLTGCGTINGSMVVESGGTVLADCGGALAFTGMVTNNGTMTVVNDTTINFYGPVVNDGVIDSIAGNVQFFGGLQNNGVILPRSQITAIGNEGNDIRVTWTCLGGRSYVLQSTKAAAIAAYSTNYADASPVIAISGVGESTTNYLDVGAAYAPVLAAPNGQIVTTSTAPSTVGCSAQYTRGLADSLGQALPVGSLLMLGTFGISESAIQSNFSAGNVNAILSAFTPYTNSFAVGDGTGQPASWDVSLNAAGFGGQKIYLLAIDAPTWAAANHLGVFTAPSWVFPADGGEVDIDLEDVTDFVIGTHGGALMVNLGLGPPYTFNDTARLSYLPGRQLYYRVRLVQ